MWGDLSISLAKHARVICVCAKSFAIALGVCDFFAGCQRLFFSRTTNIVEPDAIGSTAKIWNYFRAFMTKIQTFAKHVGSLLCYFVAADCAPVAEVFVFHATFYLGPGACSVFYGPVLHFPITQLKLLILTLHINQASIIHKPKIFLTFFTFIFGLALYTTWWAL